MSGRYFVEERDGCWQVWHRAVTGIYVLEWREVAQCPTRDAALAALRLLGGES